VCGKFAAEVQTLKGDNLRRCKPSSPQWSFQVNQTENALCFSADYTLDELKRLFSWI
jgi:hypothetical protein